MNTLNIIKKQIQKAAAQHDAQINITRYRGTDCKVHQGGESVHGTFCYRGRTYTKWLALICVSPHRRGLFLYIII